MIDRWHVHKNLREAIERLLSHTPGLEETKGEAGRLASPRQVENAPAPLVRKHDAWRSIEPRQ